MSKKQSPIKNKNKKNESQKNNGLRNKLVLAGLVVAAVIVAAIAYYYLTTQPAAVQAESWSLDASGHMSFPENRGPVVATSHLAEDNPNFTIEEVVYQSFGESIYANLTIPKNVTKPPVVVILPAASITKATDRPMAELLSGMGYASITLDEHGDTGETAVFAGDWQDGFNSFVNNSAPTQYKQIYDALRAYDYVKSRSDLDGNDTAILGESIGGMWSIIAAGVEPQFKGVITVSASNFNFPVYDNAEANKFLTSVEPSNYLSLLPPRKLVMIHFTNDTIIPISEGKALFNNASQPKAWYQYEGTTHGLPNATYMPDLQRELQGMLGK